MPNNLQSIRNTIREINLGAEKTTVLFRELDRMTHTGRKATVMGTPAELKAVNEELGRMERTLRRIADTRRSGGFLPGRGDAGQRTVAGGMTPQQAKQKAMADQEKAWLRQRQKEYLASFGTSNRAIQRAERLLGRYGLKLKDLS